MLTEANDYECLTCKGTGNDPLCYCEIATGPDETVRCPDCDGMGEVA